MELELFQNTTAGTLVPISGTLANGTPWTHQAFLPHPLQADSPDLTGACYRAVANARGALAALDSTGQRLPNPRLFRHSTLRLEAQSTAALEGTYEPLARVLAAVEAEADDSSLREVLNYVAVAETAFAWAEQGRPWNIADLANLQFALLDGTSGESEHSGRVRGIQVVVGRRPGVAPSELPIRAARYVPPPPGPDLEARIRDLLAWMESGHPEIDPVVAAAMGHYAFEALHPFHDGNGRLGRLLIVLQLNKAGLLLEPTLSVSPWFEARRNEYYDALLGVSTRSDWSTWVEFFAVGLAESADTTRRRMLALADVQANLKDRLRASRVRTGNARVLVDFAVGHPTFTVSQSAAVLGITPTGAKKLIDSLVSIDVLAPYGVRSYNRLFHAPEVLRVLLGRQ